MYHNHTIRDHVHHTLAEHRTGCARLKPFKSVILAFLKQPPASTFYFIISSDGSSFRLLFLHIAGPQNNHNAKSRWIIRTLFSNHQVLRWPTRVTLASSLPPSSSSTTSPSTPSSAGREVTYQGHAGLGRPVPAPLYPVPRKTPQVGICQSIEKKTYKNMKQIPYQRLNLKKTFLQERRLWEWEWNRSWQRRTDQTSPSGAMIIILIIIIIIIIRGAILRQIRIFFEHCSKGGGGANPCSKNMLQILYDYKGLLAT